MNILKFFIAVNISCLLCCGNIHAQYNYAGTKSPYNFQPQNYTSAPSGYKPVFIEYTGRHASRFFTKPGADMDLLKIMEQKNLTPLGKKILIAVKKIYAVQKNEYGNITLSGKDELRGIGERMRENYPSVWQGRGVDVVWTNELRTHQSEAAFMQGFGKYDSSKIHIASPPDSLNDALRFWNISSAYKKYKKGSLIKSKMDSLLQNPRTIQVSKNICSRVFKSFDTANAWELTQNLYDLYCIYPLMKKEIAAKGWSGSDFTILAKAFTTKDLQWLDFVNMAEDFYEKGPGENINGIQIKIAAPLLADFLNSIDTAIQQPSSLDAKLNFTHAEAISPFATIMEIPQASHTSTSVFDYAKNWHAEKIMQMASNIQWILYSNGNAYLVKVLHNEQEVHLPISTTTFPYYKWKDVKDFYTKKLQSFGIDEHTDLHEYLLKLRN
ncbi:histidine-type phosphatase [Arachidicoccus ginsenosidimutans]|uniref:histidine-type phosphatase n=1 Tax=Arachidicoccus sp. BS20 TaxID=1850526 RepID=UPI0018D42C20|nr:histidine-type phosphatase [Arachidicoccus sp. BS20]